MANQEALIAEYNALRQELLQMMQMNVQFKGAALAVAAAFVVYGFQAQNSIAFVAANVILIATLYYNVRCIKAVVKVGTYIYALIEPNIEGLRWETIAVEMRKKEKHNLSNLTPSQIIFIYALLGSGCLFFTWWFVKNYLIFNLILYCCTTLILAISFVILSVSTVHYSSEKYHLDCVGQWKKIEEDLYPKVAAIHSNS